MKNMASAGKLHHNSLLKNEMFLMNGFYNQDYRFTRKVKPAAVLRG